MAQQKRFNLYKAPFIRKADEKEYGTDRMMYDFIIALIPLMLFGWLKNGLLPYIKGSLNSSFLTMLYPLVFFFIGGFTSWLLEFLYYKFFVKVNNPLEKVKYSFAIIPGLLLSMILSINTPIWVLIIGCVFATVVAKLLFGGFGQNIFNPALVGYLFITTAFLGMVTGGNGFLNPTEVEIITSGATPMATFSKNPVADFDVLTKEYGGIWSFILGTTPGAICETNALLCLISFAWLCYRKVISWRIPVIYVGTVFVLSYIIGAFNGYALDLRYPLYAITSGGLMFGAVFMATEPVTSPRTPNGKVMFALCLGVLTILFRYMSNMNEGVAVSILVMNAFCIILDRLSASLRVEASNKKIIIKYSLFGLILIGISLYVVLSFATNHELNQIFISGGFNI